MLKPEILGQLLVMQSFVISLPDEKSIFSFVCRGLQDMPGVSAVRYSVSPQDQDYESTTVRIPVSLGERFLGEMLLTLDDKELFAPYLDYMNNFCYMLAVVLEERSQRLQNDQLKAELELRVQQRTNQLEAEIAERILIEESLLESESRFRSLLNTIPDLIWLKDADGVYLSCNVIFERFFGAKEADILGKTDYDFVEKELADFFREHDRKAMAANSPSSNEEWITFPDDGQRVLLYTTKTPMYDNNGALIGVLGVGRNITEIRSSQEEKSKLEAQLHQAQKMESVGRLAGGVAHDFNNMLSVILGHAELGLMRLDPANPVCADLKEIKSAAQRSADLTRQLLAFARKQTISPKVIDLNDTVANMLKMLQRLIGEDIHLTWQPSPELCQVKIDPSQLDQILANLCVNARDAIEDTGRISIETGTCTIDTDYSAANPEATPGEYVRLVVSDNGKGMDKETLTHIFEPFYTTKGVGEGTGLGLATVYGAVKQNNGFINIYSEPGKGSTFSIHLPHYAEDFLRKHAEEAAQAVPRGHETILLVEDEPAILEITSQLLEMQDYTVLRAVNPGRAMELAREHHGTIHLLMTDVIMPEMNGRDLARNILAIHPGMKRLFMSGYTADIIAHHGVLDEGVHFIQKPFSLPDMAAMVRKVLDVG